MPCILVSRREFSRPAPRCPSHLPSRERIWWLLTGSSPSSRFLRRYSSFGAMTVGTNGLTCGFNWHCTADAIGYAVMITARLDSLPSPHSLSRVGSTPAGRQPGQGLCSTVISVVNSHGVGAVRSTGLFLKTPPNSCPAVLQTGVVFFSRPALRG